MGEGGHRGLHALAWNSDWFVALFTALVIGQSNYSGFGLLYK